MTKRIIKFKMRSEVVMGFKLVFISNKLGFVRKLYLIIQIPIAFSDGTFTYLVEGCNWKKKWQNSFNFINRHHFVNW